MISAGTLTPEELLAWRDGGQSLRAARRAISEECEIAALLPAIRIPMNEIPARLAEIPARTPIVVICHLGERSARVAAFLAVSGFSHVYNLEGGIDAYASRVDPTMPRY